MDISLHADAAADARVGATAAPCGVCRTAPGRYTCPRCKLRYCTVACYRGHGGGACVAGFESDKVQQCMESVGRETVDEDVRRATHGILLREGAAREEQAAEEEEAERAAALKAAEDALAALEVVGHADRRRGGGGAGAESAAAAALREARRQEEGARRVVEEVLPPVLRSAFEAYARTVEEEGADEGLREYCNAEGLRAPWWEGGEEEEEGLAGLLPSSAAVGEAAAAAAASAAHPKLTCYVAEVLLACAVAARVYDCDDEGWQGDAAGAVEVALDASPALGPAFRPRPEEMHASFASALGSVVNAAAAMPAFRGASRQALSTLLASDLLALTRTERRAQRALDKLVLLFHSAAASAEGGCGAGAGAGAAAPDAKRRRKKKGGRSAASALQKVAKKAEFYKALCGGRWEVVVSLREELCAELKERSSLLS